MDVPLSPASWITLSDRAFELVNKWGDAIEGTDYTFEEIAEAGRYFAAFKRKPVEEGKSK